MRRPLGIALAISTSCLAPLALACRPSMPPPSGEPLGTFDVDGTLEDNSCRPGFEPIDPLAFTVELQELNGAILWRMGGGPPVGGTLRDDHTFRLVTRTQVPAWPADPENGVVGCTLEQIETVSGSLVMGSGDEDGGQGDAGARSTDGGSVDGGTSARAISFTAESEIELVPVVGSECSALLLVNGGSFPSLPCSAVYRLEGQRR